ncbi:MAG: DUF1304 domain-containing protein [Pseudobdellovibrionaceae bacterium]
MTHLEFILIVLIALLHIFFLILEMFLWTKPFGLMVFNQTSERAKSSAILAANQGLYNGFLAAGLLWSLVQPEPSFAFQLKCFFLTCVIAAGFYGGYSVNRKIILIQALPAIVAFVVIIGK